VIVDNVNLFDQVLEDDEYVVRTYKPHKGRFWASRLLGHLPGLFLVMIFLLIYVGVSAFAAFSTGTAIVVTISVAVGLPALYFAIEVLAGIPWYRSRYYCLTNHRIIIQCGIFAQNFRFMDLSRAAERSNGVVRFFF